PALGGALVDAFGWRSIFLLPVPFCIAGVMLAVFTLPDTRGRARRLFDWRGTLLLIGALVALLNVTVVGHRTGWLSAALFGTAALGIGLSLAFVAWENRSAHPLLMLRLFRHRPFASASIVAFAYGVGLFGTTYLVPVFVQDIAGYSPVGAGNLFFLPGLVLAGTIILAGRLTDRASARYIIAAGLSCFAVSSLLLALATGVTAFWLLALWLGIGRAGLG